MAGLLSVMTSSEVRLGQCAFYRPSVRVNPLRDRGSLQSCFERPVAKRHRDSVEGQHPRCRFVSTLLSRCFPSHIAWFVIFGVINSSERMRLAGRWPHVIKEVVEVQPSFANRDSEPAVSMESLHRRVLATPNHGVPRSPFFRPFAANSVPMNCHKTSVSVMASHYTGRLVFG